MLEQPSTDAPLMPDAAPESARRLPRIIKASAGFFWDLSKRVWRLDAVKSAALTWAIRVSPIGGAIIYGIIDSYMSAS